MNLTLYEEICSGIYYFALGNHNVSDVYSHVFYEILGDAEAFM